MIHRRFVAVAALALSLAVGVAFAVPTPASNALPSQAKDAKPVADGEYTVDPVHTTVMFRVQHYETSWFYGRFGDVSGKVNYSAATPEKASVEFTVKTASIDTFHPARNTHVKSAEFFDVEQFPTATFKSKKVAKSATGLSVTGDFTLHGVTKELTFEVLHLAGGKDMKGNVIGGFEGKLEFKRSDFGIKTFLPAVGDDITLLVSIEALKS